MIPMVSPFCGTKNPTLILDPCGLVFPHVDCVSFVRGDRDCPMCGRELSGLSQINRRGGHICGLVFANVDCVSSLKRNRDCLMYEEKLLGFTSFSIKRDRVTNSFWGPKGQTK